MNKVASHRRHDISDEARIYLAVKVQTADQRMIIVILSTLYFVY